MEPGITYLVEAQWYRKALRDAHGKQGVAAFPLT
ncbi:UNVERIFIED_ORG: hypothetical protein FHT06_001947 [Xanthomonas campestris]